MIYYSSKKHPPITEGKKKEVRGILDPILASDMDSAIFAIGIVPSCIESRSLDLYYYLKRGMAVSEKTDALIVKAEFPGLDFPGSITITPVTAEDMDCGIPLPKNVIVWKEESYLW